MRRDKVVKKMIKLNLWAESMWLSRITFRILLHHRKNTHIWNSLQLLRSFTVPLTHVKPGSYSDLHVWHRSRYLQYDYTIMQNPPRIVPNVRFGIKSKRRVLVSVKHRVCQRPWSIRGQVPQASLRTRCSGKPKSSPK